MITGTNTYKGNFIFPQPWLCKNTCLRETKSLLNTYLPSWDSYLISVNAEEPLPYYSETSVQFPQLMNTMTGMLLFFCSPWCPGSECYSKPWFITMRWHSKSYNEDVFSASTLGIALSPTRSWIIIYRLHRHLCNCLHPRSCCFRGVGSRGEPCHCFHLSAAQGERIATILAPFSPSSETVEDPALLLSKTICSCSW